MSDVQTLLLNKIKESLEDLSKEGVGHIDCEDAEGIRYCVDGRHFYISVKEIGATN